MPTLHAQMHDQLLELIHLLDLADQKERILKFFTLLTAESLNISPADLTPQWSTINNNGIPFQLDVSLGQKAEGLRFLTEVGAGAFPPFKQITFSYIRLQTICEELGWFKHGQLIREAGENLLPQDPETIGMLQAGTMWIGLGFFKSTLPKLSVYYEVRWGSLEERWLRLFKFLLKQGCYGAVEQLRGLLRTMSCFSQPLGVAIDLDDQGLRIIKLYFRTFRTAINELSQVLDKAGFTAQPLILNALSNTLLKSGEAFPPNAIVYYLAIAPHSDQIEAIKVDVCSHCIKLSDQETKERWIELAHHLGIETETYLKVLDLFLDPSTTDLKEMCHAFLGIGIDSKERIKLNSYLRPILKDGKTDKMLKKDTIPDIRQFSKSIY